VSEVSAKPSIQSTRNTDYITGVYRRDKQLVLLVDIAKALSVEDLQAMAAGARTQSAA
jgi:chemotaxis signal transduction protein